MSQRSLNSLGILEIRGEASDKALRQLKLLAARPGQTGATSLPEELTTCPLPTLAGICCCRGQTASSLLLHWSVQQRHYEGASRAESSGPAHSSRHRSRADQLMSEQEWTGKNKSLIRALSLTDDPDKFLGRVLERVDNEAWPNLPKLSRKAPHHRQPRATSASHPYRRLKSNPRSRRPAGMFNMIGGAQVRRHAG